ncbi:MAG: hypothetical protein ACQEQ4_06630 [Fibrobacterota bacterium]
MPPVFLHFHRKQYILLPFFVWFFVYSLLVPAAGIAEEKNVYPPWFQRIEYPHWFFYPPQNTVLGYDIAKDERKDAYDRFCSFEKMRTSGYIQVHRYEHLGRLRFTDQDSISFYYIPRPDINPEDFFPLDSITTATGRAVLFSPDSLHISRTSKPLLTDCDSAQSGNEEPGYTYGYGRARVNLYNPLRAWMEAESAAIRDLMQKSVFSLYTLNRSSSQGIEQTSRYEFDLAVENLDIQKRWFEQETGNARVAVRVRTQDIHPWETHVPSCVQHIIHTAAPFKISPFILKQFSKKNLY